MSTRLVGLPWFDGSDYETLRERLSDGSHLPESYEEWLRSALAQVHTIEREGGEVFLAAIRPEEFAAWCAERHTATDAAARIAFAYEQARKADTSESRNTLKQIRQRPTGSN